jgi:hypothetical protein
LTVLTHLVDMSLLHVVTVVRVSIVAAVGQDGKLIEDEVEDTDEVAAAASSRCLCRCLCCCWCVWAHFDSDA